MKTFLDASSLCKKYVQEPGRAQLMAVLDKTTDIFVAPFCLTELHAMVARRLRDRQLRPADAARILKIMGTDFQYFRVVPWDMRLEAAGIEVIARRSLRTLDAIVVAASLLAKADAFYTADQRMYQAAATLSKDVFLLQDQEG